VHDSAEIIRSDFSMLQCVQHYQEKNPEVSESEQSSRRWYYAGQRAATARACREFQLYL